MISMLLPNLNKKRALLFTFVGILISFVILFGLRFALIQDKHTHYHANFAIYINGQQINFDSPLYFEEVQTCSGDFENDPKHRAHMHDQKSGLVHVHDEGVTWGHFLANLGFGVTKDLIQTNTGTYVDGVDGNKLSFYLNEQEVDSIANTVIGNEDKLLIDYGKPYTDKEELVQKYAKIPRDANVANNTKDPASCSGNELTTKERFKRAFKFWE